jgi:nitric oxide reductase NorE protein
MTESTSSATVLSDGRPVADSESSHLPGDGHMWVMVLGDLAIFGAYFLIYMVHRTMAPEAFLSAQQHLNVTIGVLNTMVLLTSSLFVARSVYAARSGRPDRAIKFTYAGGACGVLFVAIKGYEWRTSSSRSTTSSRVCTCCTWCSG